MMMMIPLSEAYRLHPSTKDHDLLFVIMDATFGPYQPEEPHEWETAEFLGLDWFETTCPLCSQDEQTCRCREVYYFG